MSNTGADGTGLAIGMNMMEAEKTKQRRLSNMGKDQVLIETKMSGDAVGNAISKLWDNWYYKEGKIYQKRGEIPFNGGVFLRISFLTGIGLLLFWVIFVEITEWIESIPLDRGSGFIVSVIVGLLFGIIIGFTDDEIDYIRITTLKNTTAVLIKIYDSDGYRNIDDDDILQISEQIKPIDMQRSSG